MSANPDSVANQGLFHSRVPPSHPITTSGVSLMVFAQLEAINRVSQRLIISTISINSAKR